MPTEQARADAAQSTTTAQKWWCNFCNYRTDDEELYLAHSCIDVLAERGELPNSKERNECR